MDAIELRKRYLKRFDSLMTERSSWDPHWRDLAEFIHPHRSRFWASQVNKGDRRNQSIINAAATRAARILASGMMAGITSPARAWFQITTPDPALADRQNVKAWLSQVVERMLDAFSKSNVYRALHATYEDLGVPGTSAFLLEEDAQSVMWAYTQPIGEYCLASNARLVVDTLYRELRMTVGQLMERAKSDGWNPSPRVKDLYERGDLDTWIDVVRVVEPRRQYDARKVGGKNMPIASCWFEKDGDVEVGILNEGGYRESPLLAPRWDVLGEDVYGHSPGMEALGDVRALQLYEMRKAQGVERIVEPPLVGPSSLRNQMASMFPGGITYLDMAVNGQKLEPIVQIHPAVIEASNDSIDRIERRIEAAFYADLWLMMSQEGDPQKTAREIVERHEEKMLQLGPVMERLEAELLNPLISRAFGILQRAGLLPPPPPELQGQDLRIEYLSVMAQAQKMVKGQSIQQLAGFVLQFAQVKPDVFDKVNTDEMVAQYADSLGLPPSLINPQDQVDAARQQRAQAQAQQAQAEQAAAMAKSAKDLGQTDMSQDSLLNRVVGGVAGAEAAS